MNVTLPLHWFTLQRSKYHLHIERWDSYMTSCGLILLLKKEMETKNGIWLKLLMSTEVGRGTVTPLSAVLRRFTLTQSPTGSDGKLKLQQSRLPTVAWTGGEKELQSGPRLRPVGRAVSVHPAHPIIWKIVCVRRVEKKKKKKLSDSAVPGFSAC